MFEPLKLFNAEVVAVFPTILGTGAAVCGRPGALPANFLFKR
jgi:hypothetical protein